MLYPIHNLDSEPAAGAAAVSVTSLLPRLSPDFPHFSRKLSGNHSETIQQAPALANATKDDKGSQCHSSKGINAIREYLINNIQHRLSIGSPRGK